METVDRVLSWAYFNPGSLLAASPSLVRRNSSYGRVLAKPARLRAAESGLCGEASGHTNRQLLVGLLALQDGLIRQAQLHAGFQA